MEIIYNIKLMKENTLLIKKKTFKYVFLFLRTKTVLQNSVLKHKFFFFFLKTQKTVFKNYSQKLFSRTVFKNSNQTSP